MPELLPFRGYRFRVDDPGACTAPPYDVIDAEARAALAAAHPYNVVRLVLPESPADAAGLVKEWLAAGVLAPDPEPAVYVYRMTEPGSPPRTTEGVVGVLVLEPLVPGSGVLPHEETMRKLRSDRRAVLEATRMNLSPVFCLSPASSLAGALVTPGPPAVTFTDEAGIRHEVHAVTAPDAIDRAQRAIAAAPLVIADGHHRYETALGYAMDHPGDAGAAGRLAFVAPLDAARLHIEPIHRLVRRVAADPGAVLARLQEDFVLEEVPATPGAAALADLVAGRGRGTIGLLPGGAVDLPTVAIVARVAPPPGPDAAAARLVERFVLPALGADLDDDVAYWASPARVETELAGTPDGVALLCAPVSLADVRAAAEAGTRMPRKTSFFWPKPRSGLVMRSLDD